MQTSVCGVVLAGGASRRMGQPKAALLMEGEPLLHRVVRLLGEALPAVIVVGDPTVAELVPETRLIADAFPGRGPLGGLRTAFDATDVPWLFLVACDMPFLRPALIRAMAHRALVVADADVVALPGSGGLEPLHAWYSRRCVPVIDEQVACWDWSMRHLLGRLKVDVTATEEWLRCDPEHHSATNVNTPEDWTAAQAYLRRLSTPPTTDSPRSRSC